MNLKLITAIASFSLLGCSFLAEPCLAEQKNSMNDDMNAPSVLMVPRPNAIVVPAPVPDVAKAISKFIHAEEYGQPQKVRNLLEMQGALMNWQMKVGDKAQAVGIAKVGDDTAIFDFTFQLPANVDFIRDLSKQTNGRVVAGIAETHSGCYGLIVADKGTVIRHFYDDGGRISANEGRLPAEQPKLEDDSFGGVEDTWQKLVPQQEVKNLEIHVFAKEPITDALNKWDANIKNVDALIKAGDDAAAAHDYRKALENYRDAFKGAQASSLQNPGDRKMFDKVDQLMKKLSDCQNKLLVTAGADQAGTLQAPRPAAIAVASSIAATCEAIKKLTNTKEYETAKRVPSLPEMGSALTRSSEHPSMTPTFSLGFARAGAQTIIFDPQVQLPLDKSFICQLSKALNARVASGVIAPKPRIYSLIVADGGKQTRNFYMVADKVSCTEGTTSEELKDLKNDPATNIENLWRTLVPPAVLSDFEVHTFSEEPSHAALNPRDYDDSKPDEIPPGARLHVRALSPSETLGVMLRHADDLYAKHDYESALPNYESVLMMAQMLKKQFPDDSKQGELVKTIEEKIKECQSRLSK